MSGPNPLLRVEAYKFEEMPQRLPNAHQSRKSPLPRISESVDVIMDPSNLEAPEPQGDSAAQTASRDVAFTNLGQPDSTRGTPESDPLPSDSKPNATIQAFAHASSSVS